MSEQGDEIRTFLERFVAAENSVDIAGIDACLAPDVEVWLNGQLVRNTAAAQVEATRANLAAFPDWRREILAIAVDGNIGVLRWTGAGTHEGPFGGIPASGNRVTISGTSWADVVDGVAKRIWIDMDMAGPIAQMTAPSERSG